MLQALKIGLQIERYNRKNWLALIAVIVIMCASIVLVNVLKVGDQLVEGQDDYYMTQSALAKFQIQDASADGDGTPLYKNLTAQKNEIALQMAAVDLAHYDLYYEASLHIAEIRKEAFKLDDYDKVEALLPSKLQNELNYLYFKYHVNAKTNTLVDPTAYIPFLLIFFSTIGIGWYLFMAIFTSAIMIDDFEHMSLIKGYPVRFDAYMISKCLIMMLYVCAAILFMFICPLVLLMNGFGDLSQPIRIYNGQAELTTAAFYIARAVLYMVVISIFVILLSIILNVWLKNAYLTMIVHVILFALPLLFPSLISIVPWNPYNFMNFNEILNGTPVDLETPTYITMNTGLIIWLVSIIIMGFIIRFFLSTGRLSRV